MCWYRVATLTLRIVKQFWRDKRTFALVFVVPILVLTIFAYVIGTEVKNIKVAFVSEDEGIEVAGVKLSFSQFLKEALDEEETFKVVSVSSQKARELLESSEVKAVIEIPKSFTKNVLKGRGEIRLFLEGSDYVINGALISGFNKIQPNLLEKLSHSKLGPSEGNQIPRFKLDVSYLHAGKNYTITDYLGPIYIAFFVFFFVFLLTVVSFIRERSQGTLERILASPMRKGEIITGYVLGFSVFALIQSLVILLFAIYVLKINYVGELYNVFFVEALLVGGAVNLGIFLSTFAKNELQAVQFIPLVIVPQVLLGGFIWPVESLPRFLEWTAKLMPLTYANFALQAIMIRGQSLVDIKGEIFALFIFALFTLLLGVATLKREVA
jgi:ABC-2 type transport system permease protein